MREMASFTRALARV